MPGIEKTRAGASRRISVGVLLALGIVLGQKDAEGESVGRRISFEPYLYETRLEGEVVAELGRFEVPANRRLADEAVFELVFVRLPALPDFAGGPPIVYLAGGPGGSGIEAGRGSRLPLFQALRKSGDVLLFDQRGTGDSSTPEHEECPFETSYPLDRPLELEPFLDLVQANAAECARWWAERGVDLDAYDTMESAADLEALRVGLGAEQLDLLGISYGTHLALAYARTYPDRVRRMVLAGVEGPDHTVKLPSQFEGQLRRIEALFDVTSAGGADLRSAIGRVRSRLERSPAEIRIHNLEGPDTEVRLVVGWRDVAAVTQNLLQDPESALQLPELYRRLEAGDFTDVAGTALRLREVGGLEAMPEAMDAASGISPQRKQRILEEDRSTLLGSGVLLANLAITRGLGVADLGPAYRAPLESDVETLFISGSLDGRTPASNATEVAQGFSRARHVVVENGGHGNDLLVATPELEAAIVDFFLGRPQQRLDIQLPPPHAGDRRVRSSLTPKAARRYVGEYERRDREIWRILHRETIESLDAAGEVVAANAVLQIRWDGNGFPLHPVSEGLFYIDFPWFIDTDFRFEFDDSGTVTHLSFEGGDGEVVRMEKVH